MTQSPFGKAIAYTLTRWQKLCVYTTDGILQIDNNLIENAIRPVALGRKNYLFAGSHERAQDAAMLYSLFATCRLHNINPEHWLTTYSKKSTAPKSKTYTNCCHKTMMPTLNNNDGVGRRDTLFLHKILCPLLTS
ncbi:MAG: transposase [Sphingobacteriales bacterium]|nr:transposase [Sphingobacteriales bacterium]